MSMLIRLTENLAVRADDVKIMQYISNTGSIKVELLSGSTWSLPGESKRRFNKLVQAISVAQG